VSRCPATPAEFALIEFLAPVDFARHAAIVRMVFEEVGTCLGCEDAVRRCDPRRLDARGLRHLRCGGRA
jgi:hypothetical protein